MSIDIELVTARELASAVERGLALHQPKTRRHTHYRSGESYERVTCSECNHRYPCPTVVALELTPELVIGERAP